MSSFRQILMKKFVCLGTEYVEFLKTARASQGNLLSLCCVFCLSRVSLSISLFEFSLFHVADALAKANAGIASLEAKLEASQKAWDVATAAKATAEKTAKAAATKAKKAEKALTDANQGRIQREEAITERLNQILALAGGKYLSTLFIVCLLILLMVTYYPFISACRENWGILGAAAAG
jgi:hypothetical protein